MEDMENFSNGHNTSMEDKENRPEQTEMEKKVDNLTDKLVEAFQPDTDLEKIKWSASVESDEEGENMGKSRCNVKY